ncbi:bifunctional PIG-L family deacetylase/class I SAM-dependent methyltransferase [Phycicoccus flavus]|uniref:bifunctional PIG-L family deacetylase/class I SAM-dependent methyltransferase n=1 Tax=Phycicoccus flavus TaxID=2502783 RepID=UPI000FEB5E83|nr:bifunctional PIG-L family deacetylase/class I SAM-dependent methyltransferase [Phycicoccus flavus]NHA66443.1 methyltransferase domain-containing protein [Phycicoccus flavus]
MTARVQPLFHHSDPGTPEPAWLLDPRWADVPLVDVPGLADRYDDVLVLAAHPDDESLAVGGLVAAAARAGLPVRVLVATRGEGSHPHATAWTPRLLAQVRRAEATLAVGRLAPGAPVDQLELPDGGLEAAEDVLVAEVAGRRGPRTLVLAPWTGDGHPDHDALGRAAARAVGDGSGLAHYPLWLWHWGSPDELDWSRAHVVELTPADLDAKAGALEAYPSQTRPLGPGSGDEAVLTPPVLRRAARVVELLLAADGVLPVRPARADDTVAEPFDAMYDDGPDPWGFRGSFYESRKRDLTAALLGRERYRRVLEIGCADGLLTRRLAGRADEVVAVDVSARALEQARRDAPAHVAWVRGRAPGAVPDGPFDLVVVSEVGYFLTPVELLATLRRVHAALAPEGEVVLVHWRHSTDEVPLDGPTVHAQAGAVLADLGHRVRHADADVLADVWGGPGSVAAAEGRR